MKIIAVCSTIEFQNRATIEAISEEYGCIDVICKRHIRDFFKPKTKSSKIKISYLHSIIPESLVKYKILLKIELLITKIKIGWLVKKYNTSLFTNTHVAYLLPLFEKTKKIALFVDPYTLMNEGKSTESEIALIKKCDAVLCTSKKLAHKYIPKYLGVKNANTYYWPNTVDLSIWDINKFSHKKKSAVPILGYAGNMNEITIDIPLLDRITDHFDNCKFIMAGKLNFKNKIHTLQMEKIFSKGNVEYVGLIPYSQLQQEVFNWDVCLMLDRIYELSEYVHHNKVYQYLALGKPVVGIKTHNDYEPLSECVFEARSPEEFISCIQSALTIRNQKPFIEKCIELAKMNSSTNRAHQFMEILNTQ